MILPAGEISSAVTVPSGLLLRGANAGKAVGETRDDETVFSDIVTFEGDVSVDGVKITARPVIKNAENVEIKNSVIEAVEVDSTGTHMAKAVIGIDTEWKEPVKLVFTGNEFGDNTNVYNVFEINAPLADGTAITGNTFSAAVGSHNVLNIYAVEDDATIDISNNKFAKSANALRVGTRGAASGVEIILANNEYDVTDSEVAYAGLLLIQPYGTATTDMGGVRIDLNDTVNNSGVDQLWYYYAGAKDAILTDAQKPELYVDGVKQSYPA